MRVGLEVTSWTNPRGYGRFTRGLISALLSTLDDHEYVLIADTVTTSDPALQALAARSGAELIGIQTRGSFSAGDDEPRGMSDLLRMSLAVSRLYLDALFFPSIYSYFPVWRGRIRHLLVGIHDVTADDYPKLMFPRWRDRTLWQVKGQMARAQASRIIAVSDHARAGVIRRYRVPPERVSVVGEAPDSDFRPLTDRGTINTVLVRWNLQDARFFMCLGGLNPHKNISMLVDVFDDLRRTFPDVHLVLVGPAEDDIFTPGVLPLRDQIRAGGLDTHVHLTGYLPQEDVVCLLNAAAALVMPSLNEGFGLGAVEAAACGTPVIATTSSPLPSLLEGGGWFIDPAAPTELAEALRQCLTDEPSRRERGRVALERARWLTWERAVDQFREVLGQFR